MKKKIIILLIIVSVIFSVLLLLFSHSIKYTIDYFKYYSWSDDPMPDLKKVTKNSKTIFTPVLDTIIIPDKNLIYCESFQHALNKMCKEILNGKPIIKGECQKYIDKLNKMVDNTNELTLMSSKFKPIINVSASDNMIKFCTSTNIEIKQFQKLQYISEPLIFKYGSNEAAVKSFGFYKGSARYYIRGNIYCYKDNKKSINDQDYVIIMHLGDSPINNQFEIFLAKIKPRNTLMESFKDTLDFIKKNKDNTNDIIGVNNELLIPKIIFNLDFSLDFLSNKSINDKYIISPNSFNKISFKINGYRDNAIELGHYNFYGPINYGSFSYEFNTPFFLFICKYEKNKSYPPYFGAYIANDELLLKK